MKTTLRHPYSRFFGTLANQIRIDILMLLRRGELNATQIAEKLRLKQPTASKNLVRLEECGFVFAKRRGKECIYSLNKDTIEKILPVMERHMEKYCCHLTE